MPSTDRKAADESNRGDGAVVVSNAIFAIGIVGIAVAAASSLMLSIQHLAGISLPGCGPESACGQLAAGAWGKVPGIGWPTSFVGLGYFVGLLVAWLAARPGLGRGMVWLIRAGALASIVLVTVMVAEGHLCLYCLAVHVGNFGLLVATELAPRRDAGGGRVMGMAGGGFAAVSLSLLVALLISRQVAEREAEGELTDSTRRIIERSGRDGSGTAFTGRWLRGPEIAPIRIVMWVSYQCVDCKRIEAEANQLLASRDDVSLSIKHFPMSSGCNPHMKGRNPHPNSCWAARAAEAAGILRGNDGFWQMHDWLFARAGSFTDAELPVGLRSMGYDADPFIALMTGDETLRRVQADIEEAVSYGLHYTPFIFVNGEELRGWNAPDALTRMVRQVAATNPPPRTAEGDEPPQAIEKYIDDWRTQPRMSVQPSASPHRLGNDGAPVQIVAWIDYDHSSLALFSQAARDLVGERDDVVVEFRHYPIDQSCNTYAQRTINPDACMMAQAVETAGILGGDAAYWRMHEWLVASGESFAVSDLIEYAAHMGFGRETFLSTMQRDEVKQAILADCAAGKRTGLRSVPWLILNGRFVPRWQMNDQPILRELAEAARQEQQRGM